MRLVENMDHLYVKYDFYGRIWSLTSCWLGFSKAFQMILLDHLVQFGGIGGLLEKCSFDAYYYLNISDLNHMERAK